MPSNGLIDCISADEKKLLATAFEPYQELFQGVITCVHSDFRIGGLKPGETKKLRGALYLMEADVQALLARYRTDFPEHFATTAHNSNPARPESKSVTRPRPGGRVPVSGR